MMEIVFLTALTLSTKLNGPIGAPNVFDLRSAHNMEQQECCANAKITVRCTFYMSALKVNPNLGEQEVVGRRKSVGDLLFLYLSTFQRYRRFCAPARHLFPTHL